MLNKLIARLGQPTKSKGSENYFRCPECALLGCDTSGDNLMYNSKKDVLTCHANTEHSHKLYGELIKNDNTYKKPIAKANRIKPKVVNGRSVIKGKSELIDFHTQCSLNLLCNSNLLAYLEKKRGIGKDIAAKAGIGFDSISNSWIFPVYNSGVLVGFEHRDAGLISGKNKQVWKQPGTPCCLANINNITPDTKYLIILEGFIDAYCYWQYLADIGEDHLYYILTPSMGVDKIKKHINKLKFTDFERVFIFVDNDNAGKNQLEELKKLCRFAFDIMQFPCTCCEDFNDYYLKHKRVIEEVIEPVKCVICGNTTYETSIGPVCLSCKPLAKYNQTDTYTDWLEIINICDSKDSLDSIGKAIAECEPDKAVREKLKTGYKQRLLALNGKN